MLPSKTINPLHFEDLEPKRFEDLVRQLIYDFRNWRQLEANIKDPEIVTLCKGIMESQQREIDQMETMLKR